ncbi:hypothetical protein WN865_03275 [Tetragenococcus halophilus]
MKTTTPREEQEVILNYDVLEDEWHYYSDCPKYNRKWAPVIKETRKEYNDTGQITLLEGTVSGSVSIRKALTQEQKERAAKNLQRSLS